MRRSVIPVSSVGRRGAAASGRDKAESTASGAAEVPADVPATLDKALASQALLGTLSPLSAAAVPLPLPLAAVFDDLGATPTLALGAAIAIIGAAGAGYYAHSTVRRRDAAPSHSVSGPMPLSDLDRTASRALVSADDAVRTSAEELRYATAESGPDVTAPFAASLDDARRDLTSAFHLRFLADLGVAGTESEQRDLLTDIAEHCRSAEKRLDRDGPAFDRLRALVREADRAWAAAVRALREQRARVEPVHQVHDRITAAYAPPATAAVADTVRLAWERLVFADDGLEAAHVDLKAGDKHRAASLIRGAEAAIDQAKRLLDAVMRRAADLDGAMHWLPGVLADLEADTGAAQRRAALPVSPLIAATTSLLDTLHAEMASRPDPLECMRRATEGSTQLAALLATTRTAAVNTLHVRTACDQLGLTARSEIAAADDLVTTRRAVVGHAARTQLSEARRHLHDSSVLLPREPSEALAEVREADALAREAVRLALADVRRAADQIRGELASAVGGGIVSVGGDAPGFGGERTRWRLAG